MLQEKKAMFYFMYFFLDYFNVSGDRVCFTKILVGKKKERKTSSQTIKLDKTNIEYVPVMHYLNSTFLLLFKFYFLK